MKKTLAQLLSSLMVGPEDAEPLPYKRAVDINTDSEDGDVVLHADGHFEQLAHETFDFVERRIRELNPDDPDAATKLLCGGCLRAIVDNMATEILMRSNATHEQAAHYWVGRIKHAKRRGSLHMMYIDAGHGDQPLTTPLKEGKSEKASKKASSKAKSRKKAIA